MGRFIKGQSGNPHGRPKGTPNKGTNFKKQLEEKGFDFPNEWLQAFHELKTPHDRLSALMAAAPYLYPKVKKDEVGAHDKNSKTVFIIPDNGRCPPQNK